MPLDTHLIDESMNHARNQLIAARQTDCPHIHLLENFLHQLMLEKLLNFLRSYENWKDTDQPGRKILNWEFDTVVEEIHICMEGITQSVNDLMQAKHTKFLGLNIWKDVEPFKIMPHSDNPIIGTSLQIYLNDCDANLATSFSYNDQIIDLKYVSNTGYIMNNDMRIEHWMNTPIPKNFERYSLYAIWGI